MGLSRNKVAVSEGAAGSPPFYGEHDKRAKADLSKTKNREKKYHDKGFGEFVVQSSGSFERPKRVKLCGLIAQVVRARA